MKEDAFMTIFPSSPQWNKSKESLKCESFRFLCVKNSSFSSQQKKILSALERH